jgi:hypothetical protein
MSGGTIRSLLAECKVGERAAVDIYEESTHKGLPTEIHSVLDRQYQAIKAARDRIEILEAQGR